MRRCLTRNVLKNLKLKHCDFLYSHFCKPYLLCCCSRNCWNQNRFRS